MSRPRWWSAASASRFPVRWCRRSTWKASSTCSTRMGATSSRSKRSARSSRPVGDVVERSCRCGPEQDGHGHARQHGVRRRCRSSRGTRRSVLRRTSRSLRRWRESWRSGRSPSRPGRCDSRSPLVTSATESTSSGDRGTGPTAERPARRSWRTTSASRRSLREAWSDAVARHVWHERQLSHLGHVPIRAMADGTVESFESEMDDNVTLGEQKPTPKPVSGQPLSGSTTATSSPCTRTCAKAANPPSCCRRARR